MLIPALKQYFNSLQNKISSTRFKKFPKFRKFRNLTKNSKLDFQKF